MDPQAMAHADRPANRADMIGIGGPLCHDGPDLVPAAQLGEDHGFCVRFCDRFGFLGSRRTINSWKASGW
jgi:hypothetical protein